MNPILALHIAGGGAALLVGPVAMLARKGPGAHTLAGRIYAGAMMLVVVSSLVLAIEKRLIFLGIVGVFSFQLVATEWRAWGFGRRASYATDRLLQAFCGLMGLALAAFGARLLMLGESFGSVAVIFGLGSATLATRLLVLLGKPEVPRRLAVVYHIAGMGGGYIATLTAFLVVNVSVSPAWLPWLLPTALGTPLIARAIRRRGGYAPDVVG